MFTWTDRRVIDQNWQAHSDKELVTDEKIKSVLSEQISSNIRIIRDKLKEIADGK